MATDLYELALSPEAGTPFARAARPHDASQPRQAALREPAALLNSLRRGDAGAFDALYRALRPGVVAYLTLALNCAEDVDDVSQQVFLSVFHAAPRFHGDAASLERWVFRIVRNQAINHIKQRRRSTSEEPDSIDRRREFLQRDLVLSSIAWGANASLHECVEQLPIAQRQVLVLRYLLDLNHTEIAEVLGRTAASVRQINSRALASLERQLLAQAPTAPHPRRHRTPLGEPA